MGERQARIQRMVADRVTDEMLTKPVGQLTDAETAILQAALRGAHAAEIMDRMKALGHD